MDDLDKVFKVIIIIELTVCFFFLGFMLAANWNKIGGMLLPFCLVLSFALILIINKYCQRRK